MFQNCGAWNVGAPQQQATLPNSTAWPTNVHFQFSEFISRGAVKNPPGARIKNLAKGTGQSAPPSITTVAAKKRHT